MAQSGAQSSEDMVSVDSSWAVSEHYMEDNYYFDFENVQSCSTVQNPADRGEYKTTHKLLPVLVSLYQALNVNVIFICFQTVRFGPD